MKPLELGLTKTATAISPAGIDAVFLFSSNTFGSASYRNIIKITFEMSVMSVQDSQILASTVQTACDSRSVLFRVGETGNQVWAKANNTDGI